MYFLDNLLVSKFEITGNLGASLGGLEEMLRSRIVIIATTRLIFGPARHLSSQQPILSAEGG